MARGISVRTNPNDTRGALKRTLKYLGAYKLLIFLIIVLSIGGNILGLLGPDFAGKAINEAAAGAGKVNFDRVYYYAKRMLVCYLLSSLVTFSISILMTFVSRRIAGKMRSDVFGKLMKLPVGYFDRNQAGDIISRVSYDIDVISTCLATDVVQIISSITTVAGSFIMMIVISPLLSVIALVTLPLALYYTRWMRGKTQPRFSKRSKVYGKMNGFVEEMFSGRRTINAYAYDSGVNARYDVINNEAADAYYDAEFYGVTMGPTVGSINNIGLALVGIFGSVLYLLNRINLGQISSFVLYSRKFSGPINEVANIVNELYSALAAAERVFTLLDEPEEVTDDPDAATLEEVEGHVEVKNVSFGYLPGKTIIHDLSLDAPPGKLVAIVGPTGAGKTTVINLLMRFYDVESGGIFVDGKEIRTLTRKSLRKAYAMVLQDTWVFEGTIFDNIAYGKDNATMEEVVAAAKAAHIHQFITTLPQGYKTVISEDGGNISKGQKQLLTIARAMLYDARMLILDEATSNVDTDTEKKIQKAMRDLMKDKTCFVIAHRLSTIRHADWILVFKDGDVIEQGTHKTLMADRGFYYDLYSAQFE